MHSNLANSLNTADREKKAIVSLHEMDHPILEVYLSAKASMYAPTPQALNDVAERFPDLNESQRGAVAKLGCEQPVLVVQGYVCFIQHLIQS